MTKRELEFIERLLLHVKPQDEQVQKALARRAAWSAARRAAESAAWSAAESAARSAARSAAESALALTVLALQQSAAELLDRMIAVTETQEAMHPSR